MKFYRLKIDDRLIVNEGVENLTDDELHSACHERGMIISSENSAEQLQLWLDHHIHKRISTTTSHIPQTEKPMKIAHTKASGAFCV